MLWNEELSFANKSSFNFNRVFGVKKVGQAKVTCRAD